MNPAAVVPANPISSAVHTPLVPAHASGRGVRRFSIAVGALLACLALSLLGATSASAHAVVVSTSPADGARLAKAPASVSVHFDEAVGLNLGYLRVVNSSGQTADTGGAGHPAGDGTSISVGLKSGLGDGTYLVSWRVISADSHPVTGSVRFVVGNGALGVVHTNGAPATSTTVSVLLAVVHGLSFAGIAALAGCWLVLALWPSGRQRPAVLRLIWTGWTVALLGAIAEFLAQGPYDAGSSPSTFWHWALVTATLHSDTGQLISLRLVMLGALGALLTLLLLARYPVRRGYAAEAATMLGVGILITFGASGHSQSASPRWFAILVDTLHLGAASIWLGGLAVLLVAAYGTSYKTGRPGVIEAYAYEAADEVFAYPDGDVGQSNFGQGGAGHGDVGQDDVGQGDVEQSDAEHGDVGQDDVGQDDELAELAAGLPTFSIVAITAVATLAITGTIQAWREVGVLTALWQTTYGRLVLAKIALFLILVGLGYLARKRVRSGPDDATLVRRLRLGVAVEVLAGVSVLAVTGVLISQPPGRAALDAIRSKPKVTTVAITASSKAVVEISPGKHGSVQIAVQLTGRITPTSVIATAALPSKELGPLPVGLQVAGPNDYTASNVLLPSAGQWQITITVQTSEFDSTTAVAILKLE